ncbi:MAG: diguanylate cyclase, partial [Caldimonas sp.]
MTADLFSPGVRSAMPALITLAFAAAIGSLAAYVSLDLARRVRVLRTRAGSLWLVGAASALAIGIWSSQIIGMAAEPLPFPLFYDPLGLCGVWLAALVAGIAGLGAVAGRVATPGRVAFGAVALGIGTVGTQALALMPIGLTPGIEWQPLPLLGAFAGAAGGCMIALGVFFRGGERTRPIGWRWQAAAAFAFGISLGVSQQLVIGAAGLSSQVASAYADRLTSTALTLLASVGSVAILLVGLLFSVLEANLRRSLRRAESELERSSFRDGLTGLPNRLMFDGLLAQAVQAADRDRKKLAILFVDLDGFKPVNESLGHLTGDLLLREIAARLKRFARPEDRVAHLGGDEYVMLVGADPTGEDAAIFAERLQTSIGEPCRMNGQEATVSSSIGIALYPEHGPASEV